MDMTTILKAIQLVGEATPAGTALFKGFIALTTGSDQATLKNQYAAAQLRSDDLHQRVQDA